MENKRNKFLTVTAAICCNSGSSSTSISGSPFSDVKESHADFEGISTLYAKQGLLVVTQMVHSNQIQMSHVDKRQK